MYGALSRLFDAEVGKVALRLEREGASEGRGASGAVCWRVLFSRWRRSAQSWRYRTVPYRSCCNVVRVVREGKGGTADRMETSVKQRRKNSEVRESGRPGHAHTRKCRGQGRELSLHLQIMAVVPIAPHPTLCSAPSQSLAPPATATLLPSTTAHYTCPGVVVALRVCRYSTSLARLDLRTHARIDS